MSLVMKLVRTCCKKHFCRREEFNRNRAIYKLGTPGSGYEHRYEVVEDHTNDPTWDEPDYPKVTVFSSDEKSECEKFIIGHTSASAHHITHGVSGEDDKDLHGRIPLNTAIGNYEIRENGVCGVCDLYDQRKDALAEGRVRPFYLVAFGISKHYGGPEEGGWWYDWTSIHEVRRAFTLEQGLRHARELKEKYPQPRYNRHSAANRGEDDNYIVLCYGENDPRWPEETKERPRWE